MDIGKDNVSLCEKACFMASAMGYLASFDAQGDMTRMVLKAPDGFTVAGEFRPTREEAVLSASINFMNHGKQHDTAAGSGDK